MTLLGWLVDRVKEQQNGGWRIPGGKIVGRKVRLYQRLAVSAMHLALLGCTRKRANVREVKCKVRYVLHFRLHYFCDMPVTIARTLHTTEWISSTNIVAMIRANCTSDMCSCKIVYITC